MKTLIESTIMHDELDALTESISSIISYVSCIFTHMDNIIVGMYL